MEYGHRSAYFRRVVGAGMIIAFVATVFAPAMAASQSPPDKSSAFSNKSIEKVVANSSSDSGVRTERTPANPPKQATRSGSFFKTRTGAVVLVIMALGTGYAVYSAKEDRIKGINR